jgi:hypothetical protein
MIQITAIEAFDDHLSWIAKVFEYPYRFFIYSVGIIILSEGTVVHVGELASNLSIIEEVINVHFINVAVLVERTLIS